jgi:hypothetical protein
MRGYLGLVAFVFGGGTLAGCVGGDNFEPTHRFDPVHAVNDPWRAEVPVPDEAFAQASCYWYGLTDGGRTLAAYDPRRGLAFSLSLESALTDFAISVDGRAYGVSQRALYEVDPTDGRVRERQALPGPLSGLAVHPTDGSVWLVQGTDLVRLDLDSQAIESRASLVDVRDVAFSKDGARLYVLHHASIEVLDIVSGVKTAFEVPGAIGAVSLHPRSDERLGLMVPGRATDIAQWRLALLDPRAEETIGARPFGDQFLRDDELSAGAFWGERCGNLSPGGEADLIRSVAVEGSSCMGESSRIVVVSAHPDGGENPVHVTIAGGHGDARYLQNPDRPGAYRVRVRAWTDEHYTDESNVTVNVRDCGDSPMVPRIRATTSLTEEGVVHFQLDHRGEPSPGTGFVWSFGDGTTGQSSVPAISHRYSPAETDRDAESVSYDVAVESRGRAESGRRAVQTISVRNEYAVAKGRGRIEPPATYEYRPAQARWGWVGRVSIENMEEHALRFDRREIRLQPCIAGANEQLLRDERVTIVVDAHAAIEVAVPFRSDEIGEDICGAAVVWSGSAPAGRQLIRTAYFELRDNLAESRLVADLNFAALLERARRDGLVGTGDILESELERLEREGRLELPEGREVPRGPVLLGGEGEECTPGETAPYAGLVCMRTDEDFREFPAYIPNARRGDILLSPGCGTIGQLLREVSPQQFYTHTGLMTRSYYEVRHSTAAERRPRDFPTRGLPFKSCGFETNAMRFGWPGVVAQPVGLAFTAESMTHPDGSVYSIGPFSHSPARCSEPPFEDLTWPRVIMPPRTGGFSAVGRARAEEIASATEETEGHYRFFAYSQAAISLDTGFDAPTDPAFEDPSRATMCSSLIWTAAQLADPVRTLEGSTLEAYDMMKSAELGELDGLYRYTEAERLSAGNWLHDEYERQVEEVAGWFGALFTDADTVIPNQVANCFGLDECSPPAWYQPAMGGPSEPCDPEGPSPPPEEELWHSPGDGETVSPDDLLFWDPPSDTVGVYGDDELLVFRSARFRPVYRWVETPGGTGVIEGLVFGPDAEPAAFPVVRVHDQEMVGDETGAFRFENVPAGTHEVDAFIVVEPDEGRWDGPGLYEGSSGLIEIETSEEETGVMIGLLPPGEEFRQVLITGSMQVIDYEYFGYDEGGVYVFDLVADLHPAELTRTLTFTTCTGAEIRTELRFILTLDPFTFDVHIDAFHTMFEGTDCSNTDNDGQTMIGIDLDPGEVNSLGTLVINSEEDEPDEATINYIVRNDRAP